MWDRAQVYLQVAQANGAQEWSTRFSSMMFKVLQDAYVNSPVHAANQDQVVALAQRRSDTPGSRQVRPCTSLAEACMQ